MKSYTPKFLRTSSKASAWYICALFVCAGIFGYPRLTDAALTSPVPVVTGTQYGTIESGAIEDLGLRQTVSNTQYEYGWSEEHPENRRMVSIVSGTENLLVAAYVNTGGDATGCSTTPCKRLQFRVSHDNGTTWASALEGSTPWLPILGPKFDYTLYVDPVNQQDIWVSYTYSTRNVTTGPTGNTRDYTRSRIQKLVFNTTSLSTWSIGSITREPCEIVTSTCVGITMVAVQKLANGGSRVWGAYSYTESGGNRNIHLSYNDDFFGSSNWIQVNPAIGISQNDGLGSMMSETRLQATPIGDERIPAFFFADPKNVYGVNVPPVVECRSLDEGEPVRIAAPANQLASNLLVTFAPSCSNIPSCIIGDRLPLAVERNTNFTGLCNTFGATHGVMLGFSVAAKVTSEYTSRVLIAYAGGVDSSFTASTTIRTRQCDVTITDTSTAANVTNCTAIADLPTSANFSNPSTGYDADGNAWVVARNTSTNALAVFKEETGVWTKTDLPSTVGTSNIASALEDSTAGVEVNSALLPFFWSDQGRSRLAFSANAGGTTIGTSPVVTSNPIHGYGWSSNFGWLSVNCVNKPLVNCDHIFGMGIGSTPHGDDGTETTQLPHIVNGTTNISPTTTKTFPIGGYAWSSNAGFLSFERRDSICDTGAGCTGGEDNDYGNPPGMPYKNAGASFTANVPLAKYDTATQHVYGWGRFLNLCNYDTANKRCRDKDNGWVRMRGYYTTGAPSQTGTLVSGTTINFSGFPESTCQLGRFPDNAVIVIGAEISFVNVSGCSGTTLNFSPAVIYSGNQQVTVYNVTGKDYGLDAFWTGNHYELAGWAWSYDYGWIRFNPLIFIGFAWIETLFGNVYSGDQIILPDAKDLTGTRIKTCGVNGNEDCYVATYRIEAKNNITGVTFSSTGEFVDAPVSAGGAIDKAGGDCATDDIFCVLQGGATADVLTRSGLLGTKFPTVGSTTVSYRNALGKLDVGGLTTIVNDSSSGYTNKVSSTRGFYGIAGTDVNRFGNTVYKTIQTNPTTWTVQELAGWKNATWQSTEAPVLPLNVLTDTNSVAEKNTLRSQVVHVQGNLTVDGQSAAWAAIIGGNIAIAPGATVRVSSATGAFPTSTAIGSGNASCSGCAFVVDPGGPNEEYFSYAGFSGTDFTGVRRIYSCPVGGCVTHAAGEEVRWVWRLPYEDNSGTNLAQRTTIVVDGNLDIQYNIIAADRATDLDISSAALADSIRDVSTLAFVVKGNVTIAKEVNKLTAAIIATGTDTAQEPLATGGIISTGDDNDPSICDASTKVCRPLTIIGLLFARQFQFQRIGNLEKNDTPAERVIADERLFLNPPPGMEDVTKALPNPTRTLP